MSNDRTWFGDSTLERPLPGMDTRQCGRRLSRAVQPARTGPRDAPGNVHRPTRRLHLDRRPRLRRVRRPAAARPVQDVRRVSVQPAVDDQDLGRTNARCVAGDDRQGVLRRARRGPALRAPGLARVCRARGPAGCVDGMGHVDRFTPGTRCRQGTGAHPALYPPEPVRAHRGRADRPGPGDGSVRTADVRERDAGVVVVAARDGRAVGDL